MTVRERAAKAVAAGAGRAAARLVGLMDSKSDHVSVDAARHTLAIAGIKPSADGTSVNVNLSVRAGWIIDLRNGREPDDPKNLIVGGTDAPALPAPEASK